MSISSDRSNRRRISRTTLIILTSVLILMSVLPSVFPNNWVIDLLSHFKFQYCITLLILTVLNITLGKSKYLNLIIFLCFIWNSIFIIPLFKGGGNDPSQDKTTLSIACINLFSSNSQFEKVIGFVNEKDPDILILQELTPKWEQGIKKVILNYPYRFVLPRQDNFGIALLSKNEIETDVEIFNDLDIPSIIGTLKFEKKQLSILATHPVPPIGSSHFNSRNRQLESIAETRQEYYNNVIIIGDLNTTSYSTHFRTLTKAASLYDSRKGFGLLHTWPVSFMPMRVTLDHCLVGGDIKVLKRETGSNIGSDHLPIYAEISF